MARESIKDRYGPPYGPIFGDTVEPDDIETGTNYVLRSLSKPPFVAEHRTLIHKIGATGGKVAARSTVDEAVERIRDGMITGLVYGLARTSNILPLARR